MKIWSVNPSVFFSPSMKCRDMNPGNHTSELQRRDIEHTLNEVPGYESRQ